MLACSFRLAGVPRAMARGHQRPCPCPCSLSVSCWLARRRRCDGGNPPGGSPSAIHGVDPLTLSIGGRWWRRQGGHKPGWIFERAKGHVGLYHANCQLQDVQPNPHQLNFAAKALAKESSSVPGPGWATIFSSSMIVSERPTRPVPPLELCPYWHESPSIKSFIWVSDARTPNSTLTPRSRRTKRQGK